MAFACRTCQQPSSTRDLLASIIEPCYLTRPSLHAQQSRHRMPRLQTRCYHPCLGIYSHHKSPPFIPLPSWLTSPSWKSRGPALKPGYRFQVLIVIVTLLRSLIARCFLAGVISIPSQPMEAASRQPADPLSPVFFSAPPNPEENPRLLLALDREIKYLPICPPKTPLLNPLPAGSPEIK